MNPARLINDYKVYRKPECQISKLLEKTARAHTLLAFQDDFILLSLAILVLVIGTERASDDYQ